MENREVRKVIRFKNTISTKVKEFIKAQTNFSEAVTFLIEKEVYENGIRNLIKYIPALRDEDFFENQIFFKAKENVPEVKTEEKKEEKKTIPDGYEL